MTPEREGNVVGIVAVAENGAIGRKKQIPWHYPEDFRHFKETTRGHVVVMGRATHESIGRPLPDRTNVVLSRTHPEGADRRGVVWTSDPDDAIRTAEEEGRDLFVIGGAAVYALYAERIDRWIITRIPEAVEDADTFFSVTLDDFARTGSHEIGDAGLRVEQWMRKPSPSSGRHPGA